MAEISATITSVALTEIEFRFNIKEKHSISLKNTHRFRIQAPKSKDSNSALVNMTSMVTSVDSDEVYIKVQAKAIFEFSEIPEDYDEIGKEKCFEILQGIINDKIDSIMDTMGLAKLNLNKQEKTII